MSLRKAAGETEQHKILHDGGVRVVLTNIIPQNSVSAKHKPILGDVEAAHIQ